MRLVTFIFSALLRVQRRAAQILQVLVREDVNARRSRLQCRYPTAPWALLLVVQGEPGLEPSDDLSCLLVVVETLQRQVDGKLPSVHMFLRQASN